MRQETYPFADKIPFICPLILDSAKPGDIKKIYLFGSYAYGKPAKKSGIDLCVIIGNNLDRSNPIPQRRASAYAAHRTWHGGSACLFQMKKAH